MFFSQSIITLKEIKLNDTEKSVDISAEKEEANNINLLAESDTKKEELLEEEGDTENRNNTVNESEEIINDSQPKYDSSINLSLTPTKHSSDPPTQKNLLNKFNSLECEENEDDKKVDEEDEVEKENKIINVEEIANQKPSVKRRSTRKSTNRYVTKKPEELSKAKMKNESSESSTPNVEYTPKGKTKKNLQTVQENNDEALSSKTKNNVSDCGDKGKLRNEDIVDENISEPMKPLTTSTVNVAETLVNLKENEKSDVLNMLMKYSVNEKTDVSEKLVKTSEELCKTNSKKDVIDKGSNSNESEIGDILTSKISNENCNTCTEPIVQTQVITYTNEFIPQYRDDNLKSSNNTTDKNETADKIIKKPEKIVSEPKEKTPEEILKSDVKENSSKIPPPPIEDSSFKTEEVPNNMECHTELSDEPLNNLTSEKHVTGDKSVLTDTQYNKEAISPFIDPANISLANDNKTETIVAVESAGKENNIEVMVTTDQNSSGDSNASNWSMATPEKKVCRKRKMLGSNNEKFSPKLLRSKRLSLTKLTPDISTAKNDKKAKITPKNAKANKSSDENTSKKSLNTVTANSDELNNSSVKQSTSESDIDSKHSSLESELSEERKAYKRKNQDQEVTCPSHSKKQKNSEETNQDSQELLKNNTIKPHKKKLIKSILKSSPNNLEQWLIKSGKADVKTSLPSSNEQSDSQSESKLINSDSEIQISSSEPKKNIVEMSPMSKDTDKSSSDSEENVVKIIEVVDPPSNVIVISDSVESSEKMEIPANDAEPDEENDSDDSDLGSDDDGSIPSIIEPEIPRTRRPIVNEKEDIKSIKRQFLEVIKRSAEEEEENGKNPKQEDNLKPTKTENDDDFLAESLRCYETEIERSIREYDNHDVSNRVKLESLIYAKYKTSLRRPHRRKRLLRRLKKQDDENDFMEIEEEEPFDIRRERLMTPFRPSSGRSAQMVKMVTTEEELPVTPVRGRKSIAPLQLTVK